MKQLGRSIRSANTMMNVQLACTLACFVQFMVQRDMPHAVPAFGVAMLGSNPRTTLFSGCQRASCETYGRDPCTLLHERLSTDSARSRTTQRHWDDLNSIAQQELTLSIFHTILSLIRLVFITSHLVYYSTMTSLDL